MTKTQRFIINAILILVMLIAIIRWATAQSDDLQARCEYWTIHGSGCDILSQK